MGKTGHLLVVAMAFVTASCGAYPRDMSGTIDRIRQSEKIRVGLATLDPADAERANAFLARIERATGARAQVSAGPLEDQLSLLEDGELDLVLGDLADDTPWLTEVAVIEPLSFRPAASHTTGLAPVAANGENGWIALLEREVRNINEGAGG